MVINYNDEHALIIVTSIDLLDDEYDDEPTEDIDWEILFRRLKNIGGALDLVTSFNKIWFPLANFLGPNDDFTNGITQRFSVLYCKGEPGLATDFRVIMTACRN